MLNKIKQFFAVLKIKPNPNITTPVINTVQEDTRDQETRKRVAKYFEENHTLIIARALRPHSYECVESDLCEKDPCWEFVPDKIIGKPYIVKGR